MNVLFVGATGLVGGQVVPILKDEFDLTLAAFDRHEYAGMQVHPIDVSNWDSTLDLVSRGTASGEPFDALVNCVTADYRRSDGTRNSETQRVYYENCITINARGSYHLFEAARRAGVKRVVLISSMTALLGKPRHTLIGPDTEDRPTDLYAASKIFTEHVGRTYAYNDAPGEEPMRVICLRLGQPMSDNLTEKEWCAQHRLLLLDRRDLASAIACALRVDVQFGVYPIASENDLPTFLDPAAYAELGYRPAWKFTEHGVRPVNEEAIEEPIAC